MTQIRVETPQEVWTKVSDTLELETTCSKATFVVSAVRRLCSFMCPCPPSAIVRMACQSLSATGLRTDELRSLVEDALQDMLVCGDLLELSRVVLPHAENHPGWLYCAPPSFVVRQNGGVHIFGIAADGAEFLPKDLRARLIRDGAARYFDEPDHSIGSQLKKLGLREVSAAAWMTAVYAATAQDFLEAHRKRVTHSGGYGESAGAKVLQHANETRVAYNQRWAAASSESGLYVCRYEQVYGAPLWYLCKLDKGDVQRSLLLPLKDSRDSGSDAAWRIQLAIDAVNGYPASFFRLPEHGGTTLVFDFPLPTALRRRWSFLGGRRHESPESPYRFWLPTRDVDAEVRYAINHYWFVERETRRVE